MVEAIKNNLLYKINPFWKSLKDQENGGFYGYMDYDLNLEKTAPKGVILNSRILWYFSNLYLTFGHEEDLTYAEHAYNFFKAYCVDKTYGGVYWMLTYDGNVLDDMKHTYNQAFAIYALSSYYDASKNKEALDMAMDLFDVVERKCTDEYGYLEAFNRKWELISNEKLSDDKYLSQKGLVAEKTMNTLLHVLEGYTELYRVSKEEKVGKSLRKLLIIFNEKVYNQKEDRLEVFFDKELNSLVDMHSYGHDIEAAWLLDRGAEILGDKELIETVKACTVKLAYKVKETALVDGALNNERFEDIVDTTRVWWVQAEGIVGFINAYEKTGDKAFLETAESLWNYITKHLIDKRPHSEWFWDVNDKGIPESKKPIVEPWKCPYHNGRMCMETVRRKVDV